jgi:DNA-binding LytR/AlgR family response regulator
MVKSKNSDLLPQIHALLLRLVSPLPPVPVQGTDSIILIRPEQIAYATTNKNGIFLTDSQGNTYPRYDNLSSLEKRLQEDPRFFRSHRSYLVNLELISEIKGDSTKGSKLLFRGLPDNLFAEVSQGNLSELKKKLGI